MQIKIGNAQICAQLYEFFMLFMRLWRAYVIVIIPQFVYCFRQDCTIAILVEFFVRACGESPNDIVSRYDCTF